ncbi:MAG TPA: GspH/FimT family pseudopilin [Candidatus Binatia bacterium]
MIPAAHSQRSAPGTRRGERGFTLIELILVMVIIGVIASMSIPMVQAGMRQSAVRSSVRAFISATRQASAQAVSTRKPTALIVYPHDGTFTVEGSKEKPYELPPFAQFGEIVGGVAAEADDEVRFEFFPTGSSSGGSVQIDFTPGDRRQSYRLVLDPLIGRVKIEEN